MPRLLRQSAHSVDDRIGIQGALIVIAVVAVVAGSLSIASKLDPLVRRFAPNPDNRYDRAAVVPVQPIVPVQPVIPEAPVLPATPAETPPVFRTAPALEPAPAPLSAPARQVVTAIPEPRPAVTSPSFTLPRTVLPPPPRPVVQTAEQTDQGSRSTGTRPRESRRQVARNARHLQRAGNHQSEDAYIGPTATGFGASALVAEARRYIGTNPTNMARLWCARFMNYVLKRAGYQGTGSDAALSFARYGRRISGPRIGAIAVMRRKGGGHVGIVSGIDRNGNPILISGNTPNRRGGRIVAERVYPRGRIIAYVMPR